MRPPPFPTLAALAALAAGCTMLGPFEAGADDTRSPGEDPDLDGDRDGFSEAEGDCDDADPTRHPEAEEPLNGLDDDCDGVVDEGPERDDADGDGHSPAAGDCDDGDPAVHPGARDGCNDLDDDCDGEWNEDDASLDAFEGPAGVAYDLGDLTDSQVILLAYLHSPDDVDLFRFTVVDEGQVADVLGDGFHVHAWLGGIAPGMGHALTLWQGASLLEISDGEEDELIDHYGFPLVDDGGAYELMVSSDGPVDCAAPYTLIVKMEN
ncbi:putative metal-binding motif-containing protein [Myxococcota bacterium]|nr:putative metal-binding motif-containing protein [Myxococcota bacterium]